MGRDFYSKASRFKEMSFRKEIPDPLKERVIMSSLVTVGRSVVIRIPSD